jgi:hypothetical protein
MVLIAMFCFRFATICFCNTHAVAPEGKSIEFAEVWRSEPSGRGNAKCP